MGKQESSEANPGFSSGVKDGSKSSSGEDGQQNAGPTDAAQTLYSKFKSGVAYISPNLSSAFQKVKDTKLVDLAKKGCDVVKEELRGTPTRKRRLEYTAPEVDPLANIERSTRTDIVILPKKQSRWSKKWEAIKEKVAFLTSITNLDDCFSLMHLYQYGMKFLVARQSSIQARRWVKRTGCDEDPGGMSHFWCCLPYIYISTVYQLHQDYRNYWYGKISLIFGSL